MERLIDLAARECGYRPRRLRRRNLVTEKELPYKNPFGIEYDNGDYIGVMDMALQARRLGRLQAPPRRSEEARQMSRHRRRQLCRYLDRRAARESRDHRAARGRRRTRHRRHLARPGPRDELRATDHRMARRADRDACASSPAIPTASRSAAAPIPAAACGSARSSSRNPPTTSSRKALRIAEHLLETAAADIEFKNGRFAVKGTNHSVGLFEVARAARRAQRPAGGFARAALLPPATRPSPEASYPYGAHVCEVEVDPDTGAVKSSITSRSTTSAAP